MRQCGTGSADRRRGRAIGVHTGCMRYRRLAVLAPMAGLAMFTVPGVVAPVGVPAQTQCAGGICNVCPAVASALTVTGTQIYCIA